jgi:hypothetical protein
MEIELEARLLQQIVKVVDSLDINTLPLFAGLDRLECRGVGEHHMAMAAIEIPTSVFTGYQAASKPLYFKLDIVKDVLKLADPEETIRIIGHEDSYTGQIILGTLERNCELDQYGSQPKMPSLAYSTRVEIPTKEFCRVAKAAASVSDKIAMYTKEKLFFMETDSAEKEKVQLDHLSSKAIVHRDDEDVKTIFDIGYLVRLAECTTSPGLNLGLGTNYPLEACFQICDEGQVKYLIAPTSEHVE